MTATPPSASSPGFSALVKTDAPPPRRAAQGLVDHLNAVLNGTVSDSRLTLIALPDDDLSFEITRLVEGSRAPLELLGSSRRLFTRQTIVVVDGHCRTESYSYRLESGGSAGSWLLRWEYFRDLPRPDYAYPLAHVHVNGSFASGDSAAGLHVPTRRVPLELVLWHLIAEWGVASKSDAWKDVLGQSITGFDLRRTDH